MILVLIEHADGRPEGLSLEALSLATQLADSSGEPLEAVLVGDGAREAATGLAGRGVTVAHVVEDARLAAFAPAAWATSIVQLQGAAHNYWQGRNA